MKYVHNKYKNVGSELHIVSCFMGKKIFKQFKIKLEGKLLLPGHLKAWVRAQPILLQLLNKIWFAYNEALGFLIHQYSCLKAQNLIIFFMLLPIALAILRSVPLFQWKPANKRTKHPK